MSRRNDGRTALTAVSQQRLKLRRITMDAVLTSLALVLSIVERWIPLDLIVPVPGLKLGLANIVTLFALLRLTTLDAFAILLVRSLVMGVITGPMTLIFSLTGGLLAMLVMWLLGRWEGRAFSVIGISLAGAAAHNIGQVAMAGLVLNEPLLLLTYLPPLLLTSLATGTLTGVAAFPLIRRIPPLLPGPKIVCSGSTGTAKLLAICLCLALLQPVLTGCQTDRTKETTTSDGYQKFTYEFTGTFDTVIQFIGYARDAAEFSRLTQLGEQRFHTLNQLYDTYNSYEGINNVKTINDQAGLKPVQVAADLLQLISKCLEWNKTLSDKTNIALGEVIGIWQKYRELALADPATAAVPSADELSGALAHANLNNVQVDLAAGTVYLKDPATVLDLGAVAKGYATELVAQELIAAGAESMIINAGGSNVRLIGQPRGDRETWNIGLQNPSALLPDAGVNTTAATVTAAATTAAAAATTAAVTPASEPETIATLQVNRTSVVTSGDYQRYYQIGNTVYHHLIDPADGMPPHYYRAVTVVTEDSGLADFLSTALFLLPYSQSRALAEKIPGVEVLWVFAGNHMEMTAGLSSIIKIAN